MGRRARILVAAALLLWTGSLVYELPLGSDHAELYALKGRYRELYDKQHGLEANLFLAPGEGDKIEREAPPDETGDGPGGTVGLLRKS